jgi:hypothetical protein
MGIRLKIKGNPEKTEKDIKEMISKNYLNPDIVNYGIASRIDDNVIINKNLFKYEDFAWSVAHHEIKHSNQFEKKDIAQDFTEGDIITNLLFCLKNPSGFTQFIPIGKYKGKFWIDIPLLIIYVILTGLTIWVLSL